MVKINPEVRFSGSVPRRHFTFPLDLNSEPRFATDAEDNINVVYINISLIYLYIYIYIYIYIFFFLRRAFSTFIRSGEFETKN